ncbi:MAG: DUF2088 domain-containing protein [Chloroflexi bacterium]|nr:DUF2088 domain-containing protein [Chloroflexota bacterium]
MNQFIRADQKEGLSNDQILAEIKKFFADKSDLKKVLLVPPDITRLNAYAGPITIMIYDLLKDKCEVEVMPALGTHMPMTEAELAFMYPGIPYDRFRVHNWRTDVVKIGDVPLDFVEEISENRFHEGIEVEINKRIVDPSYDLILSIGQVVPHEVAGMANYSKNIFVGCGGKKMIDRSHMISALYGIERVMGVDGTPTHKLFDYVSDKFLKDRPIFYLLTVTATDADDIVHVQSLAIGNKREIFEKSIVVSQESNFDFLEKPIKKAVVYLKPEEFRTTWVGNKSIYRTRMAMADGGELIVIAPGLKQFGEADIQDHLIRKYGYVGFEKVGKLVEENEDLRDNYGVAAHLIHGSSEGRFTITYAPGFLTREEIESVNFNYMPLEEALRRYPVDKMKEGENLINGEEVFYISNPALGLWAYKG